MKEKVKAALSLKAVVSCGLSLLVAVCCIGLWSPPAFAATNAYATIEAENYSNMSGIGSEACGEGTQDVGYIHDGDYIEFNSVAFGNGASGFDARVACTGDGGAIEIRLDSLSGTRIGTCAVTATGGWQMYGTQSCAVNSVSGTHDVYLKFTGGSGYLFNINWFRFTQSDDYLPQGYGAVATGGDSEFHVMNLNDSGSGSLRDALSGGGRHIVFDVSGTITIKSSLIIPSNTTIDGTTAPGSGITVTGYSTSMSKHHNIIIRNMRFREDTTGPKGKCSLQGSECYNIMVDHCSIEWGRWDCMSFTGDSHDITVQYCMIGQGIDPQHFGGLIDACDNVSLLHNLWIGNDNRNPKLKGNCQYINNVVYNWGNSGGLQGGHSSAAWRSDLIGNYFIKGPSSTNNSWANNCTGNDQWYQSGNYKDLNCNGSLDGTLLSTSDYSAVGVTLLSSRQHSPSAAVSIDSAGEAVGKAVSGSYGCQPTDSYDNTLIGYVRSYGTSGKIGK